MLPCAKSLLSLFKRSSPFAHNLIECLDGADGTLRILFGDAVQTGRKLPEIIRIIFLRKLPPRLTRETGIQNYHEYYAKDENWKKFCSAQQRPGSVGAGQGGAPNGADRIYSIPQTALQSFGHGADCYHRFAGGAEHFTGTDCLLQCSCDLCAGLLPAAQPSQYNLPKPPKLANFDQSLQDYKVQVQTEIEQEAATAGMTVEEYAAADFEAPQQDSFSIYQLRNEDSTRDYHFEPYDRLQAAGRTVDKANYTEVCAAPLAAGTTLEDIYRTFNVGHPADFKGHSLSVSDVVVLHQNGQDTAHYCDSVGFQQVPESCGKIRCAPQNFPQNRTKT